VGTVYQTLSQALAKLQMQLQWQCQQLNAYTHTHICMYGMYHIYKWHSNRKATSWTDTANQLNNNSSNNNSNSATQHNNFIKIPWPARLPLLQSFHVVVVVVVAFGVPANLQQMRQTAPPPPSLPSHHTLPISLQTTLCASAAIVHTQHSTLHSPHSPHSSS